MKISKNLKQLSRLISPLYIVGGAVRDDLLGYSVHDIDLTSTQKACDVIELLKNTPFSVKANSLKFGTLSISIADEKFEFTTMREDSYPLDGSHKPLEVKYTNDIYLDAKRRDFTVNALYYDIENAQVLDPLGGLTDLENRVIKTTREAKEVFAEDALRILRMIRIACENSFSIHNETLKQAKNLSHTITALAKERIQDEFLKVLSADKKNGINDAHYKGLKLLTEVGATKYIIPDLLDCQDFPQNSAYHRFNVFEHILHTILYAEEEVRLAALFHDIAKPYCQKKYGKMAHHDKYSAQIALQTLSDLKFKKSTIKETERLVYSHMFDLRGEAKASTVRRFIQKNYDIIDKIIALKIADGKASKASDVTPISVIRLKQELAYMKQNDIPFTIRDLKVNGLDALNIGLCDKQIGEAFKRLLYTCASDFTLLTRENQLRFLAQFAKK